jgi:hypothetical protein
MPKGACSICSVPLCNAVGSSRCGDYFAVDSPIPIKLAIDFTSK